MRTRFFFHIDEYGLEGFRMLPYHTVLSGELVVWCPLAPLIKKAYQKWGTPLTPKYLIKTLKESEYPPIRIVGREKFLLSKRTREKSDFLPAREWKDRYDGEIARIAAEDSSKPIKDQRVIIAEDEKGYEMAEERLSNQFNDRHSIISKVSYLLKTKALPIGIREKAIRAKNKGNKVTNVVLRDLYNHANATKESNCEAPIISLGESEIFEKLIGQKIDYSNPYFNENGIKSDNDMYNIALDILRSTGTQLTPKQFYKFILSKDVGQLRRLMITDKSGSLRTKLLNTIVSGRDKRSLFKKLLPIGLSKDPIDITLSVGSLIGLILAFYIGGIPWSAVTLAGRSVRQVGRELNLIPDYFKTGDNEFYTLLRFVFATERLKRSQINELENILLSIDQ